jgi:hypothetical protein
VNVSDNVQEMPLVFHRSFTEPGIPNVILDLQLFLCSMRKSALDELNAHFQRHSGLWCDEEMYVIGHHYKRMEKIFLFAFVVAKDIKKQALHPLRLEDIRAASR